MTYLAMALELTGVGLLTVFSVLFLFLGTIWILNKSFPNKEDE